MPAACRPAAGAGAPARRTVAARLVGTRTSYRQSCPGQPLAAVGADLAHAGASRRRLGDSAGVGRRRIPRSFRVHTAGHMSSPVQRGSCRMSSARHTAAPAHLASLRRERGAGRGAARLRSPVGGPWSQEWHCLRGHRAVFGVGAVGTTRHLAGRGLSAYRCPSGNRSQRLLVI